jgi:predicted metalloendopeptidase
VNYQYIITVLFHGTLSWDIYTMGDNVASYYLHGNDIYIPLYYLFAPVYSHDMPDSFNYGGMGAWVGYYMVYALEDDCE